MNIELTERKFSGKNKRHRIHVFMLFEGMSFIRFEKRILLKRKFGFTEKAAERERDSSNIVRNTSSKAEIY